MKILHLCAGQDTGGQAIATKRAFARLAPNDEVRVITRGHNRLGYATDIIAADPARLQAEYDWADVVVLHNTADFYWMLDRQQRKPIILHHHGTRFRTSPASVWAEGTAIGATQIVSTIDLTMVVPGVGSDAWLPQISDTATLAAIRAERYVPGKTVVVSHAPTDRIIKGTLHLIPVMYALERKFDTRLMLIERQPWDRCLAKKATSDIYVDQFMLGYGNNAIEAWAMGLPVIAGAHPPILARMREVYGELPFAETTTDTLRDQMASFIGSADLRAEYAERGMAHVRRWHAEEVMVPRLQALYAAAKPSVGGPTVAQQRAEVPVRQPRMTQRELRRRRVEAA